MSVICKGYVLTLKRTLWGVTVFNDWQSSRNRESEEKFPDDIIERHEASILNFWPLSRFVAEVR